MKFSDLKLFYGDPVHLQIVESEDQQKYPCKLIGCVQGKTILMTPPVAAKKYVRVWAGQKVQLRIMVANGICLFNSTIEYISQQPYPYIHIAYPPAVVFKEIRSATRVDDSLPINVTNTVALGETPVSEGIYADISLSGARIALKEAIGEVSDEIKIEAKVEIAGVCRKLDCNAVIRSRIERSTKEQDNDFPAVYGVEFIELTDEQKLLLSSYVFSRMVADGPSPPG